MKDPNSIMAPSDKTKVIITSDSVFQNAKCLFIEYYDVIRAPWLVFFMNAAKFGALDNIIDISEASGWKYEGWLEWYMGRKYRNPFQCFPVNPSFLDAHPEQNINETFDTMLDKLMDQPDYIQSDDIRLPFYDVLISLLTISNVADRVAIYTPTYHQTIATDIQTEFNSKVDYLYGDLAEVLRKEIPMDSTYVFSDAKNINVLEDENRLQFSSILLAERFGYNYITDVRLGTFNDEITSRLVVDLERMARNFLFKFGMFEASPYRNENLYQHNI